MFFPVFTSNGQDVSPSDGQIPKPYVRNYQGGQPLRTRIAAKRGFNLFMPVKLRSAQISEQSDQRYIYA